MLYAHKDPRTRGEKSVCIPICQSFVRSGSPVSTHRWPLQATLVQTINKTRNDTLDSASSIMYPLSSLSMSLVEREERSTGNTTSSNVVPSTSFALYYSSISSHLCVFSRFFPYFLHTFSPPSLPTYSFAPPLCFCTRDRPYLSRKQEMYAKLMRPRR